MTCSLLIPQLIYELQLCLYKDFHSPEVIQSKFLRPIFGGPCCVPSALLRLESGIVLHEAQGWYQAICFWLTLNFNLSGLTPLILSANFHSCWVKAIEDKLHFYRFLPLALCYLGFMSGKDIIKQWVWDVALQIECVKVPSGGRKLCSGRLYILESPEYWILCSTLNTLPSALWGNMHLSLTLNVLGPVNWTWLKQLTVCYCIALCIGS